MNQKVVRIDGNGSVRHIVLLRNLPGWNSSIRIACLPLGIEPCLSRTRSWRLNFPSLQIDRLDRLIDQSIALFIGLNVYSITLFILIVCLRMTTLTEVFPCFFPSCKTNARVKPAKTGHGPHLPNFCVVLCIFVLFYVLFVLCCSLYRLCVYVYCTTATGWLPNCSQLYIISYHIISYHIISYWSSAQ